MKKRYLITMSSPVALRSPATKSTYVVNVLEGYVSKSPFPPDLELRVHRYYDTATKTMIELGETITLVVKPTNIRSTQEL